MGKPNEIDKTKDEDFDMMDQLTSSTACAEAVLACRDAWYNDGKAKGIKIGRNHEKSDRFVNLFWLTVFASGVGFVVGALL